MADERTREAARTALEDAIYRMLEAGFTAQEIKDEAAYALETADE